MRCVPDPIGLNTPENVMLNFSTKTWMDGSSYRTLYPKEGYT